MISWILVLAFIIKHFIADYPLQGAYMLGKFKPTGWVKPLAAHCAVHAGFTFVISLVWLFHTPKGLPIALGMALIDFVLHFSMDRIKASPALLGRYTALSKDEFPGVMQRLHSDNEHIRIWAHESLRSNKLFWWALGLDQTVHALTDLLIIVILCGAL